jgi:hypothetical protein
MLSARGIKKQAKKSSTLAKELITIAPCFIHLTVLSEGFLLGERQN